jgi:Transposase DDE domain
MKQQYRIRNWPEYNAGLMKRGSLTFWVSEDVVEAWVSHDFTGNPGAPMLYTDLAIETVVTLKSLYNLGGRQATGFIASLFELMGIELPVPDPSTVSRRMGKLEITLPILAATRARHVVVDSTGLKVDGEGEWKVRQHGVGKRRTWLKLHLAVDEASGDILAAVVSTNNFADSQVLPDLLEQIEEDLEQVSAASKFVARCHPETCNLMLRILV